MGFFSRLESRARQVDSLLCIGLDPHLSDLPAPTATAALHFCLRLIEETADQAAAFKPNSAFFEVFGPQGIEALQRVIAAVPAGIPVILDAKRGDIASTAQAYAQAVFEASGAQAVTLSPYLGHDSLVPFLEDPERGVFLLCKTSNPGASDFQDLRVLEEAGESDRRVREDDPRLYEMVARRAVEWNRKDNLGLVVGATQPEALESVRMIAPEMWILAPGIGAQGGDLKKALEAGMRRDGEGILFPISRAVSRAASPRQAAEALRIATNEEKQKLMGERSGEGVQRPALAPSPAIGARSPASIPAGLLESGCIQFGRFTLKSGLVSPIYIDLRRLAGFPALLGEVASAYLPLLRGLAFDRLAALPYAAMPIATAISLQSGWPLVYPRKESKAYGMRAEVEGVFEEGERVVVIDDLATTGGSKFEAIEKLASAGLRVTDVVVLIDRQSGAREALARAGCRMHAVFTLSQLLEVWEQDGSITVEQIQAVRDFLASSHPDS